MALKLEFGHATDGNATVKMKVDDLEPVNFDYVMLVKWLFENHDESISLEIADSYSPEQKMRIEELVKKIEITAKGDPSSTSMSQAY